MMTEPTNIWILKEHKLESMESTSIKHWPKVQSFFFNKKQAAITKGTANLEKTFRREEKLLLESLH